MTTTALAGIGRWLRPVGDFVPSDHYLERMGERRFDPAWVTVLWAGEWRASSDHWDRFLLEAQVPGQGWWRLVVEINVDRGEFSFVTVYPLPR